MKKLYTIFLILFFFISTGYLNAQEIKYKVEIKHPTCKLCKNGEITITITDGTADNCYFYLYKGKPFTKKAKIKIKSDNFIDNTLIIKSLKIGKYWVGFEHKKDESFKYVQIELIISNK